MSRCLSVIAFTLLILSLVTSAIAQPPRRPDGPPPATVVTRVKVNVETDVHVSQDTGKAAPVKNDVGDRQADDADDSEGGDSGNGFSELVAAVLKNSGSGSSLNIITDIDVNVKTSIQVKGPPAKGGESKLHSPKGAAPDKKPPAAIDGDKKKPSQEDGAPKKKRRRKRDQKPQEAATAAAAPEETHAHIALNKLKIGQNIELGVTGQVDSEEKARAIAEQINSKTRQTLLGVALLGMVFPTEQESLNVVRQAIGSVKADAASNELSISVAIPRETPGAVKKLVEAALQR